MVHDVIEGSFFRSLFGFGKTIEFGRKFRDIFPSFHSIDTEQDCFLVFRELNVQESTNLVIKVDTVDKAKGVEVTTFNAEEVTLEQFLVTSEEVLADTRILVLNLALDASIFKDVKERLYAVTTVGDSTVPTLGRSVESMTDFVTDKQVIQVSRHFLPDRKDE